MSKFTKIVIFFLIITTTAFGQVSLDPNDDFYQDVAIWESLGAVADVPSLRPYPLAVVRSLLEQASECDIPQVQEKATYYQKKIFNKGFNIGISAHDYIKASKEGVASQLMGSGFVFGDFDLFPKLSLSYKLNIVAATDAITTMLPTYKNYSFDIVDDPIEIGPLDLNIDMNANFAYGTEAVYLQAGLNRTSFGPFAFSNIVVSEETFHMPNISFVINREKWTYVQSLFSLGATSNAYGVFNSRRKPDKYLTMHSFELRPLKNLSLSYYETIVYGNRFDFSYLLPVPYMAVQGVGGFDDNLQMGLNFKWNIAKGLVWTGDVFVDDLNMNSILKFDFDTRMKFAAKTGIFFAPTDTIFDILSFDYTLVMPYMFTHSQYVLPDNASTQILLTGYGLNFQNYTTNGMPIGCQLAPNSDGLTLNIRLRPFENVKFSYMTNYFRHGNINESISLEEAKMYLYAGKKEFVTNGSIFDYPDAGHGYLETALDSLNFLTQNNIMHIWQTGFDLSYEVALKKAGTLQFSVGYVFEYIKNYGVDSNIFLGGLYSDYPSYESIPDEAVAAALTEWESQLKDVFNNYVSISVKYMY